MGKTHSAKCESIFGTFWTPLLYTLWGQNCRWVTMCRYKIVAKLQFVGTDCSQVTIFRQWSVGYNLWEKKWRWVAIYGYRIVGKLQFCMDRTVGELQFVGTEL